jgi:hypothetical protein
VRPQQRRPGAIEQPLRRTHPGRTARAEDHPRGRDGGDHAKPRQFLVTTRRRLLRE